MQLGRIEVDMGIHRRTVRGALVAASLLLFLYIITFTIAMKLVTGLTGASAFGAPQRLKEEPIRVYASRSAGLNSTAEVIYSPVLSAVRLCQPIVVVDMSQAGLPLGDPIICYVARYMGMPIWILLLFITVLTGSWPTMVLRSWVMARRRRALGLCCRCGYDLRETLYQCPECGHMRRLGIRGRR